MPTLQKRHRPGQRIATFALLLLGGLATGLLALSYAGQQPLPAKSGLELASIDRSADPCADFYQFACGGWIAAHPIPPDLAGVGRGREIRSRTFALLSRILAEPTRDPERQKAAQYFQACVDESAIEARGLTPIDSVLTRIGAIRTIDELPELLAFLHSIAFIPGAGTQLTYRALFDFRAHHDLPTHTAAIMPSGMALPYRQLYTAGDPRSVKLRSVYLAHVRHTFMLLGAPPAAAAAAADAVVAIESGLASVALDTADTRAAESRRMSIDELQSSMPHFNWQKYLKAGSAPSPRRVEVVTPQFVRAVDAIIADSTIEALKAYLQWQVVRSSVMMMPRAFRDADFDFFTRTLRGQKQPTSRAELCVADTDDRLGGIVGKAFVAEAFGPKSRADMLALVARLNTAMDRVISSATWLSDETKSAARAKLAAIIVRIGYPERWPNYSAINVRADDALGNRQRALAHEREMDVQKIGRPPDPEEWPRVSIALGEAGYRPERNMILFPAGFLQPPLYVPARDAAVNYGAIGAMIGHEITHGFDDVGRRVDDVGRLRDWWSPADAKGFNERAACLVDQYSRYRVAGDVNLDGRFTLGENIADLGGLRLALLAYLAGPDAGAAPKLDEFTPVQRLFLGWAQAWCQNVRPEAERLGASTDPHAPGRYRVNGPLANMPEFHEAFSCKSDAPMVRPVMCRVW